MAKKQNSTELNKQERSKELAIPILASCPDYSKAAKELGICRELIYEWMKDAAYKAKVDEARSQLVAEAIERLKANMTKAVDVLVLLLDDESPVIRRGCANDILTHTGRFIELKELEQRIKALELRAA